MGQETTIILFLKRAEMQSKKKRFWKGLDEMGQEKLTQTMGQKYHTKINFSDGLL